MDITKLLKLANVYDKRMSKKAELSMEKIDNELEAMSVDELTNELEIVKENFRQAKKAAEEKVLAIKLELEKRENWKKEVMSEEMDEEFTKGRDPGGMSLEDLY